MSYEQKMSWAIACCPGHWCVVMNYENFWRKRALLPVRSRKK
jgi:hypothetical protein